MTYDPRDYWSKRFHAQGPTYVGSSRAGSAAQADAFWRVLEPRLQELTPSGTERILDYGCGTGRLAPLLNDLGTYLGVDINRPAVEHARGANPGLAFQWIGNDGILHVVTGRIDVVVAITVLQHVPESLIGSTCAELARVLSPSGRVVLIEDANPEGKRPAAHMAFRSADRYAELLGLSVVAPPVVFDAERPGSHYVVELGL